MVETTAAFAPPVLKGLTIHSENPFRFDFIVDRGDTVETSRHGGTSLQIEYAKLIKYFLAALTIPEDDLWVNLSPYEKDRIVPEEFGKTEMGRDLLAQDYLLKQLVSSLTYPESDLGKKFWETVYQKAYAKHRTTDVPLDTFNKVWIMPDKAVVYENKDKAFVLESHLKVMLEKDSLCRGTACRAPAESHKIQTELLRELILPAIEKEVNTGKNFTRLRQIYASMILAAWYKKTFKDSLLNKVYADQKKIDGVNVDDPQDKEKIYRQYLEAFKVGVYNLIKEDVNPQTQAIVPRKYFSGGTDFAQLAVTTTDTLSAADKAQLGELEKRLKRVEGNYWPSDQAQIADENEDAIDAEAETGDDFEGEQDEYLKRKLRSADPAEHEARIEKYLSSFKNNGLNYYFLARYIAEKAAGIKFEYEPEDFINEAVIAGYEASDDYSKSETTSRLDIFIARKLQQHFANLLAASWGVGSYDTQLTFRTVRGFIDNSEGSAGEQRYFSDENVLGQIDPDYLEKIRNHAKRIQEAEFDALLAETASGPEPSVILKISQGQMNQSIADILGTLQPREAMVLRLRFGLEGETPHSLREIGRIFGASPERARQIALMAIRKLRHPSISARLLSFKGVIGEEDEVPKFLPLSPQAFPKPEVRRQRPLTGAAEADLLERISGRGGRRFTPVQLRLLPYVLRNYSSGEMARLLNEDPVRMASRRRAILRTLRYLLTLGMLEEFGSKDQVLQTLLQLTSETPAQRLFRQTGLDFLLEISQGDTEGIVEMIMQMYPGLYEEQDVRDVTREHFRDIMAKITIRPGQRSPERVLSSIHQLVSSIGSQRAERRKLVLQRLIRDRFYPIIRDDVRNGTTIGRDALKVEMARSSDDPLWQALLRNADDYYKGGTAFQPRGFQAHTEYGHEPLLPAQQFGIREAVQSLMNSDSRSALHASEARIGKTIMAILSVYNIRNAGTNEYDVKKVLYTTTNQAKYEVAGELQRRTNKDLDLQIIVVDSEQGDRAEQIQQAVELAKDKTKNVVLIANYEAVRDLPEAVAAFAPDAHIIDEVENLRRGEDTKRAPIIFGIPAKYRVGVSARLVVNQPEDVAEFLLWARPQTYHLPGKDIRQARAELLSLGADELFAALDPIKVRWRRKVVMPEVEEPIEQTEYIEYSPEYEDVILKIQSEDFVDWKLTTARTDKATDKDHLFARYQLEREASVDLGLVLPESGSQNFLDMSSKIRRLDEIIEENRGQNGKVVVLVDFVEAVDRLADRYNKKYGEGSAAGISNTVSVRRRQNHIGQFRSQANPLVLIGTAQTIGSSLNLFQIPGSSFHISTLVRLSQTWVNVDDAERLVGIGQDHQVNVITLVSRFRQETRNQRGPLRTIEERIQDKLAEKREIFSHVVDGTPIIDDAARRQLEALATEAIEGKQPTATAQAERDDALLGVKPAEPPGGIDMNPNNLNLQTQGQGVDFDLPFDPQDLDKIPVNGLTPVIIQITPVHNLNLFLGLADNPPDRLSAAR